MVSKEMKLKRWVDGFIARWLFRICDQQSNHQSI